MAFLRPLISTIALLLSFSFYICVCFSLALSFDLFLLFMLYFRFCVGVWCDGNCFGFALWVETSKCMIVLGIR